MFLSTWYKGLEAFNAEKTGLDRNYWETLLQVKTAINKQLEAERKAGNVGSGLDAEVTLYCQSDLKSKLEKLGNELRFVTITSAAELAPIDNAPANAMQTDVEGLKLLAKPSEHAKCARCWHHREDVGAHEAHPELCGRCIENVDGEGEKRSFA